MKLNIWAYYNPLTPMIAATSADYSQQLHDYQSWLQSIWVIQVKDGCLSPVDESDEHLHTPQKIGLGDLEYAGLAQCHCGQVAYLQNYRLSLWFKSDPEYSFILRWHLAEDWRDPEQDDLEILESPIAF